MYMKLNHTEFPKVVLKVAVQNKVIGCSIIVAHFNNDISVFRNMVEYGVSHKLNCIHAHCSIKILSAHIGYSFKTVGCMFKLTGTAARLKMSPKL